MYVRRLSQIARHVATNVGARFTVPVDSRRPPAPYHARMKLRRLLPILFAAVVVLVGPTVPANADPLRSCISLIYNACFYSEPVFNGSEYPRTIHSSGCFALPPTRSYRLTNGITITAHSERNCAGQSAVIFSYFGFDLGFTAHSYSYAPA
jgi:hypothetical protein